MSQLKLTADSGGGTVAIKAPASTTGNAALDLTVPGTASATLDTLGRAGNILQVKQVTKTDAFSTSSTSLVDVTGLTVDITPSSASNKILVTFSGYGATSAANHGTHFHMYRGIGGASFTEISRNYNQEPTIQSQTGSNLINQILDSPNTTSVVTYKLQMKTDSSSNSGRIGAGGNAGTQDIPDSVITVMEVAA